MAPASLAGISRWPSSSDQRGLKARGDVPTVFDRPYPLVPQPAGERVIRVPAAMTGQTRRVSRRAGKSDSIDARAVALTVVRDGIETFPVAFTDEHALEIRVLCDYRDQIITEAHPDDQPAALASGHDRPRARGAAGAGIASRPADLRASLTPARAAQAQSAAESRSAATEAHLRDRP